MTYKYKDTLDKIREVLLRYGTNLETMCDCATYILSNVIPYIEIIVGEVHRKNHVWAYDSKEKYYIDITSEQFGFPPCFYSQQIEEFEKRGYIISCNFHIWNGAFQMYQQLNKGPVLIYKKKEITMAQLISDVKKSKRSFWKY
jgi:hypothetical protein